MRGLDRQVGLVTGGGSGIGQAVCVRLAEEGARVIVADIDVPGAEQTMAMIQRLGKEARAVHFDVADYAQVCRAVEEVRRSWGAVDILVNCAGWDRMEAFVKNAPEFWRKVIDINLLGTIHCCRAVLDDMIARERGKIVNVSSDAARVGSTGETVYAAAKGGVLAFSKSLAREMARYRINVNVVCPGPTDTPLIRRLAEGGGERLVEALKRAIPFGRMAYPEEVAGAIVFFASSDADFVTGQVFSVSGGLTMAG